jgi:hypothetical protein
MGCKHLPSAREEILALLTATGARSAEVSRAAGVSASRLQSLISGDRESLPIADLIALRDYLRSRLTISCAATTTEAGGDR